jgi:6-pyruvoyltetrahydropterin/6-carboxytetrahydropterin synthase
MYELHVTEGFSAAHHLRGYGDPCEQQHGHNWRVTVHVRCDRLDRVGIGIDFKVLRRGLREVLADLDHRDLNETPFFREVNPSAENIARHVFERLAAKLAGAPARLVRVTACEHDDSGATYEPESGER